MAARCLLLALALSVLAGACNRRGEHSWLGQPDHVAPGVDFYRTNDDSLVERVGPIAVYLLRLDPAQVQLTSVLSNDEVVDAEPVAEIARRHQALAAVNGGFFNRANGEPTGLLKVGGELVSDSGMPKGVVVIDTTSRGKLSLTFDRLAAKMSLTFQVGPREWTVPINGVDTTRERGHLMLYTPAYHADTDTAPTGTEWVVDGQPPRVVAVHPGGGHTPIPRGGFVLSFGGLTLPPALDALVVGVPVALSTTWKSAWGLPPSALDHASSIVNGAGLLRRDGVAFTDWRAESLTPEAFTDVRHPRTMIGRDTHGLVWLAAIDGRRPDYSIGMRFADLQRLSDRLDLSDALNLDGGGSTTMVVRGEVVNRPSDPTGSRPVGDALLVTAREPPEPAAEVPPAARAPSGGR